MTDVRRKLFQGAKVEDLIHDLDHLSASCERAAAASDDPLKRRFFEGMAAAYYLVSQKMKGKLEYVEEDVIGHLYAGIQQTERHQTKEASGDKKPYGVKICSFCGRDETEAGPLAPGPQVAICESCADLARDVIAHVREQWE